MRQMAWNRTWLAITLVTLAQNSFAYIDPGTGSIILQGILGAIAAAGTAIAVYWHKIKSFFSGNRKSDNSVQEQEQEEKTGE